MQMRNAKLPTKHEQLPTKYDRQFFIGPFENYTCINLLS